MTTKRVAGRRGDVLAAPANDHSKLGLVVEQFGSARPDDRFTGTHERRADAQEKRRMLFRRKPSDIADGRAGFVVA